MIRNWRAVALACVACACGSDPAPPPASPPVESAPPPRTSTLWPLTQGSSWTYRITDPAMGTTSKEVLVEGSGLVPGTNVSATRVLSVQSHIEERSWQSVADGKVLRLREEDSKSGAVVRVITWQPSLMMKALSDPKPAGWSETVTLVELESEKGQVNDKEKVYTWSVEALDQSVATPAGNFNNAIKLRRSRPDNAEWDARTYWLVPGVGKVREEGERLEELVHYDVK